MDIKQLDIVIEIIQKNPDYLIIGVVFVTIGKYIICEC